MTVYLVGAGPGHADLLTLRAARLLANADVVVHDRLIGDDVMSMIAPWSERIDVGKDPYGSSVSQAAINEILVEQGRQHSVVVRLKGGDPYVFGRGGEEAIALSAAGVACEVVPGITSAIAGPAAAGIPVTHRGTSSGFTVITGFQNPENPQRLDWDAVARLGMTLVILMGASRAEQIRDRLIEAGAPDKTPIAIVTRACLPTQSVQRCRLDDLGRTPIDNPAIIVVGPTAELDLAAIGTPFAAPTDRLLVHSTQGELPWQ